MKKIAESVLALLNKDEAAIKAAMIKSDNGISVYADSVHKLGNAAVMMARDEEKRFIIVVADCGKDMPCGFEGETIQLADGGVALKGDLTAENAAALPRRKDLCKMERRSLPAYAGQADLKCAGAVYYRRLQHGGAWLL